MIVLYLLLPQLVMQERYWYWCCCSDDVECEVRMDDFRLRTAMLMMTTMPTMMHLGRLELAYLMRYVYHEMRRRMLRKRSLVQQ